MFEKKLRELREEKNLSQQELANLLGVSKQSIYKWENGINKPDTENIKQLSNLFEIKIDDMLNNKELKEIKSENINILNKKQADHLKKYINILPLLGLIISFISGFYFIVIQDYSINLALLTYILLPFFIHLLIYIPFKIINLKNKW